MPRRDDWQVRIKAVERRFLAIRLGTDRLQNDVRRDPTILQGRVGPRDLTSASEDLEGTYLARMFAEFETGLRQYWETTSDTHPKTKDLLDGLAARCKIGTDQRDNAHLVREYRNSLMHEREDEEATPIPIATARSYLCTFFSFLPREW
jgi:hypothetical protein